MKNILCVLAVMLFQQAHSQLTRQWVATYNADGDYNDRYTCVAADASGNVYLGGSTVNPDVNRDYLLVKVNASGVQQWSRQFRGSGEGPDEVTAITVDATGNVYITGFAKGKNTGTDYLTIKLNSSGDTLWTRTYNNTSANGYDQPNAIFTDAAGNVYVTGQSDGDPSSAENDDYATLKYHASGVQQWVARFNGPGNSTDHAEAVVADASGNVYVTGRGRNASDDDYVTIQYNAAGVQQWIKYDDRGGNDRATAMVTDVSGNIIITGRSANGSNDDFWTLKYSSAGDLQWQQVYDYVDDDRALAITTDDSGNVFITGESDADASPVRTLDYQTVAYNPSGTQLWQMRYNGSASNDDIPSSIAAAAGAVYVTGQSDADAGNPIINDIATVSYNATTGAENWTTAFAGSGQHDDIGNAVAVSGSACILAGLTEDGTTSRNAIAIAYNSSGAQQWMQTFDGVGDNNENIRALAVDALDNVYVAGYVVNNRNDRDMALVKFSSSGIYMCRQTVNGTSTGSPDDAQGVALDNAGNATVVGYTKNSGESNDITCYQTDLNCNTLWLNKYPTTAGGSDKIYDIASDGNGNVYMTGRVDDDPSFNANDNCFTALLDASGAIVWSVMYSGTGSNEDRGSFIRLAPSGNIYVAGRTFNGSDFDILLLKYDNTGNQLWVRTYHGGNGNDDVSDFKVDSGENLYLCGRSEEAADSVYDYITLKYDSSGMQKWARTYNGAGSGNDEAEAVAFDNAGNVLVAGASDTDSSTDENSDIVTVKYDSGGNVAWVKGYDGSPQGDVADDIAVNDSNQIILTGHTNKGTVLNPVYDIITMLLDQNGSEMWTDEYNNSSDSSDVPNLIYLKGSDFYIAGSTVEAGEQRNMLVIKYSGSPVGIAGADAADAVRVFPNPFSDALHIRSGDLEGNPEFRLQDAMGRIIIHQKMAEEEITLRPDRMAEGMYYYFITSGKSIISKGKLFHVN